MKLLTPTLALVALCGLFAPTAQADDPPAGLPLPESKRPKARPATSGKIDLAQQIARYRALVKDSGRFNAKTAAGLMRKAYAEIFALDQSQVDMAAVDRDPHGLTQALFQVTTDLDARMAEFYEAGKLSDDVANAKRRVLRGIRYLREAILQRTAAKAPAKLYQHGKPALAETFPVMHWSVDPAYQAKTPAQFPRTFVLLCMGNSNVSAAISRSASEDNTFSHLAIGYRSTEPKTVEGKTYPAGTLFLLESLIETGVIIKPLAKHYEGVTRDVIFFVRDQSKQAAVDEAADAFFDRAKDGLNKGEPLGYDFSMGASHRIAGEKAAAEGKTLPDPDGYFCAGVADEIFRKAGIELFTTLTRLNPGPGSAGLFASWGISPEDPVTAPGDADVSGTLLRVAEGARIDWLESNHTRQAALQSIFRWMDEENYQLRLPLFTRALVTTMGTFNDTILDFGIVPKGMNSDILRSFYALDKAGNLYTEALEKQVAAFKAKHGRTMTPPEMHAWLEANRDRIEDTDKWLRKQPWAQGTYQLKGMWKRTVQLEIRPGEGRDFVVERKEFKRDGSLVGHSRGTASQDGKWLSVRFKRVSGTIYPRMRFKLEFGGEIQGYERQDGHGPHDRNRGPRSRRVEKGKKVSGPVN